MFTFKINYDRTEMIIYRDGVPAYKCGYNHALNAAETRYLFDDCVTRLKHQLIA